MKNKFKSFFVIASALLAIFGVSCSQDEPIVEAKPVEITIVSYPDKTTYSVGESLQLSGLKVFLFYSDNSIEDVTSQITVENFSSAVAGNYNVTISYFNGERSFTTTFPVSITGNNGNPDIDNPDPTTEDNIPGLSYISITSKPYKTNYYEGDTEFSADGLVVYATFADSSKSGPVTKYTISGFDTEMTTSSSSENKTITVTYKSAGVEKTAEFTIKVNALSLNSIEIASLPTKTKYELNEKFSKEGLVVKAKFNNGSEKEITDYTISECDTSKIATVPVEVSYLYKNRAYLNAMANSANYADEYVDYINSMYTQTASFDVYVKYMTATYTFTESVVKMAAGTDGSAGTNAEYVLFGDMPQTIKAQNVTVNTIAEENGFYIGSDGNYYSKVLENSASGEYTVIDSSETGSSGAISSSNKKQIIIKYSDGTAAKNSEDESYAYFKVEPVKWRVANKNYNNTGKTLFVCENAIDSNVSYYNVAQTRWLDGKYVYTSNYKYSRLRNYLNGLSNWEGKGLLDQIFTENAKALIATTEVVNDGESTQDHAKTLSPADGTVENANYEYVDYTCDNTNDKLFLLSVNEITNAENGFVPTLEVNSSTTYPDQDIRKRYGTDYALANHMYYDSTISDKEACSWYTRSPAEESRLPNGVAASMDDKNTYIHIYITETHGNVNWSNAFDYINGIIPALCVENY